MYCIMSHIQEEGLITLLCIIQGFFCFQCECFAQKCICTVIFFQTWYGSQRAFTIGFVSKVLFTVITCRGTCGMSGYIHFKSHFQRIFTRSIIGSEMSFPTVYSVITVVFQNLCQRGDLSCSFYSRFLANTVYIPFRIYHDGVRLLVCCIFA